MYCVSLTKNLGQTISCYVTCNYYYGLLGYIAVVLEIQIQIKIESVTTLFKIFWNPLKYTKFYSTLQLGK